MKKSHPLLPVTHEAISSHSVSHRPIGPGASSAAPEQSDYASEDDAPKPPKKRLKGKATVVKEPTPEAESVAEAVEEDEEGESEMEMDEEGETAAPSRAATKKTFVALRVLFHHSHTGS